MSIRLPQSLSEKEETKQTERIQSVLIWISWVVYLVIFSSAFYRGNWQLVIVILLSAVFLLLPFWFLKQGNFLASGFCLAVSILATATTTATIGQGIHDTAVITLPIILIFASQGLNRVGYVTVVLLSLVSAAWLVFGEFFQLYVPQPYYSPTWVDFIIIVSILLGAAFAIDSISTNIRKNLKLAQQEIVHRKRVEERLRYQSTHDVLTGIYNRTYFEEELARLERSRDFPISIIIADVDDLKIINDTLGHAAGDELLRQTTNVLRSVFRAEDMLARIGGDEFVAVLPSTDSATAEHIVSRIKRRLGDGNPGFENVPIKLSIGTATTVKHNVTGTFTLADQRMYMDKVARKAKMKQSLAV